MAFLTPGRDARVAVRRAQTMRRAVSTILLAASLPTSIHAADALRNWFDDPFFAITAALPDCPLPVGPFVTEAEMRGQSHHRAEKGTSCWLARRCDRPNAYAYDRDIAASLRAALNGRDLFAGSSLWVTVQGRVVFIEGCVDDAGTATTVEALARSLPDVQQAVANVRVGPRGHVPYRVRAAP